MTKETAEPNFAKIVKVNGQQVLFYIDSDPIYDGKARLNQMIRTEGLEVNLAISGLTF